MRALLPPLQETSWSLSFPSIQANAQFVILLAVLALETQNKLMPKASGKTRTALSLCEKDLR